MAAGRHSSYKDHEVRVRESDVEVSRRKDYYQDRLPDGDRERSRSRDTRDRVDARQRDIKEEKLSDGSHRSPLSSNSGGLSGRGQKRSRSSGRSTADREPGELSSGSGSDDPDPPVAPSRDNGAWKRENGLVAPGRDNGVWKQENGDSPLPSKKRNFSPIVWDREDNKRSSYATSRSKKDPLGHVPLPPPPPLPHGYVPSNSTGIVRQPAEQVSPSYVKVSVDSPQDRWWGDDRETGKLEEEHDFAPTRNISTSRWADGHNDLEDGEAEAFGKENIPKRSTPLPNSVDQQLHNKVPSPELGEVSREGSVGPASNSSDSEGKHQFEFQEFEVGKKDYMDVDVEEANENASDHSFDTDSEDSNGRVRTPEPVIQPQRSIYMLQGCRSVDEFERLNKIDEGTYGVVYRAKDKKSGEIVALKKVKMEKEREGFPLTSLREINILLSFHHQSIVDVKEVVVGSNLDSIFMVMEYMEHDLKALMETMKQPFSQSEVKCLMLQLLEGVKYLHDNWVLHRDLKTSNILLNNRGELKICDFGLSRQYGSPLKPYTRLVVTLWYRAPELLLGAKEYSTAIDMWSLGCIMAELLAKEPLFSGKTEFDQLDKIFRTLGTPNEKIWPGFTKLPGVKVNYVKQPYNKLREKFPPTSFSGRPTLSEAGFDLLNRLLTYDPEKRITAEDAVKHDWFREVPLPKSKDFMPTFPAQHDQDRRLRRIMKSPDPLEEQRRKELQQGDLGAGSLFG